MFKNHPKGLFVMFFSNMGERFGFYTMMAILVMYLQAKYNLGSGNAGLIYSIFYFAIYALALVGGLIADKTQNYKGVVLSGLIVMFVGYALLAIPGLGLGFAIFALFTIAFGNGLFKGNLQALVGQLYDNPKFSHLRDSAYSIFYMGINIGAFFAPNAARGIRTWYLSQYGFRYDADLPSLCNQYLEGTLKDIDKFKELVASASVNPINDLATFARQYLDVFTTGYNFAFGIAGIAMIVSLIIYILFKHHIPDRKSAEKKGEVQIPTLSKAEEKQRLVALGLVFLVVIFFWMSFHQNGLTLTFFARDYTVKMVDKFTFIFFNLFSFLTLLAGFYGLYFLLKKNASLATRLIGAIVSIVGFVLTYVQYNNFSEQNLIEPETFQQFNPIFIVVLTPVVVGLFGYLRRRGKEPSTPRKIGIGMLLAALAFAMMIFGSIGLPSPSELAGLPSPVRVSAYWLILSYFILTVAELFLSPMGLSFVSKVAPPRYQGLMQGGWLGATAIGNQLLFVGSTMWARVEIWQVWLIFVICCLISAAFIFSIMKRLERATGTVK